MHSMAIFIFSMPIVMAVWDSQWNMAYPYSSAADTVAFFLTALLIVIYQYQQKLLKYSCRKYQHCDYTNNDHIVVNALFIHDDDVRDVLTVCRRRRRDELTKVTLGKRSPTASPWPPTSSKARTSSWPKGPLAQYDLPWKRTCFELGFIWLSILQTSSCDTC